MHSVGKCLSMLRKGTLPLSVHTRMHTGQEDKRHVNSSGRVHRSPSGGVAAGLSCPLLPCLLIFPHCVLAPRNRWSSGLARGGWEEAATPQLGKQQPADELCVSACQCLFSSLSRQGRRTGLGADMQTQSLLPLPPAAWPSQSQWSPRAHACPAAWALVVECKVKERGLCGSRPVTQPLCASASSSVTWG